MARLRSRSFAKWSRVKYVSRTKERRSTENPKYVVETGTDSQFY